MGKGLFWGQTSSLERLFALTEGVYAIVLTLLVLDLKIPEAPVVTNAGLLADWYQQIPNFLAYLISFFSIAIFWMRNHWILRPLKQCDETTFWLNLLHVFFLSLLPYTSSLVGHYEQDSLAVMVFSGSLGLCGGSLIVLHRHVVRKKEWLEAVPVDVWSKPNWWVDYPAPSLALASIGLAFLSPHAALGIWFVAPVWAAWVMRR